MTLAVTILISVAYAVAVVVWLLSPHRSNLSTFELNRRHKQQDGSALLQIDRQRAHADIVTLQRIILAVAGTIIVSGLYALYGWFLGPLIALGLFAALLLSHHVPIVKRYAQKLYDEQESHVLGLVDRWQQVLRPLRQPHHVPVQKVASIEEIEHTFESWDHLLSSEQIQLQRGALRFDTFHVNDVMTPLADVVSIKKSEILGPLVLDDLHRSGHDSFPVTDTTGDYVGILRLRDVQTLDTTRKHTAKVETAMDPDIRSVVADAPITDALAELLRSQHHLLVVTDSSALPVGIITLKDILNKLLGR